MSSIGLRNQIIIILLFIFSQTTDAQKWIPIQESKLEGRSLTRTIIPDKYELYSLDVAQLETVISNAPNRSNTQSQEEGIVLTIPINGRKSENFRLLRSDVFHPDLAAKYPQIKSYTGISLENQMNVLKLSISHNGLHGMIISDHYGTIYIDKYANEIDDTYMVYHKSDFHKHLANGEGFCSVENPHDGYRESENQQRFGDCQLRKYRLALACTGEYATFHGGNVPDVLAAYNGSLNRINGIYEREFSITMELIPNTDELIYLVGATDPYTNNDGFDMLAENQSNIDAVIGLENYDIGHVYSTGGGGVASLRSPCTSRRARGVTGLGSPDNDPFWVDYVAHEIGHQFGGTHTFNNSCNNNVTTSTAFEPGSGSTIMAYAGICSPNVQNNSDDYFHAASVRQITNFIVGGSGASCAELISIENTNPEINSVSGNNHVLPISTPFVLTAEAMDVENDNLTYCWEQMDNDMVEMPPAADAIVGPSFRSYNPSPSPSRFFPRLNSILFGNNSNTWEVLPNSDRSMTFNVTVRDNNLLGGCTADDELTLSFSSQAGPFVVTSQAMTTNWNAGSSETITWDVANTNAAPVSCSTVDIYLSIDEGQTFDIPLALGVENDGEQEIVVPFVFSSRCRLMVKCATSVFLDVNDREFSISAPFTASVTPSDTTVCADQEATFVIDYTQITSDDVDVSFDLQGLPPGAMFEFTPNSSTTDVMSTLIISNLDDVEPGLYVLTVNISSELLTLTEEIELTISPLVISNIEQLSPNNGELNVSSSPFLTWTALEGISSYSVEVSKTPLFDTIEFGLTTPENIITVPNLEEQTVYYWRVKGNSLCGESSFATNQSFQTGIVNCATTQMDVNLPIEANMMSEVESTISIESQNIVAGVAVSMIINHEYIGDLTASLRAPNGATIKLFERPGLSSSTYGCSEDNINVSFSYNAENTYEDFESSCNPGVDFAIEGEYQPLDNLSLLNGQLINGDWTLVISDEFNADGGEFVEWSITTCFTDQIPPAELLNSGPLEIVNELEKNITPVVLSIASINEENTLYTLLSTPTNGRLFKLDISSSMYEEMSFGHTFSQSDISNNRIKYQVDTIESGQDMFLFDCVDDQGRYLPNNTFLINAVFDPLAAETIISSPILCAGDSTGQISAVVSGGIAPFEYSIDGVNFLDSNVFSNLVSDTYQITVRDAVGNEITTPEIVLTEPEPITIQLTFGPNEVTVDADGGVGAKQYSLDGNIYSSINVITLMDNTTYQIYVRDENQCVALAEEFTYYYISNSDVSVTDVDCKGESTGSIIISSVEGGLAPYTYSLDNNESENPEFLNLIAGDYELIIQDQLGNQYTTTIQIMEPEEELSISNSVEENNLTLTGMGGTLPYQYSLDGITYVDNTVFPNLFDGSYTGYVQDANGCIASETSIIINTSTYSLPIENISIHPNPATDQIIFSSKSNHLIQYKIIDVSGQVILESSSPSNQPIDINTLVAGMYFCKVSIDDGAKIFKLVVTR